MHVKNWQHLLKEGAGSGRPREWKYRTITTATAVTLSAIAGALFLTAPGAPLRGQGCSMSISAAFSTSKASPADSRLVQNPDQVSSDKNSVDQAQQALDALKAEQTKVDAAQAAADQLSQQADAAQSALVTSSTNTSSTAVMSAQGDVDAAQSAIALDQSSLQSYQSMQDTSLSSGTDGSYMQTLIDSAKSGLAADQQKLSDAQAALQTAQAKAGQDAASQQHLQDTTDQLLAKAAKLQQQAAAAAADLTTKQAAAQTALDSAKSTQSDNVSAFSAQLDSWTHQHRLAVAAVSAENAVTGDCRSAAKQSFGVGLGLLALALGLGIVAAFDGRRFSPATAFGALRRTPENATDLLHRTWRRIRRQPRGKDGA